MNTNDIITLSLLIALLLITLSFVLYKRKLSLMLRALFSARYFQQLLREGKSANEPTYVSAALLYFFAFPCLVLTYFHYYPLKLFDTCLSPFSLYLMACAGGLACFLLSQLFLWYFTMIFNYQEHRYLYSTIKTIYRFYHALLLISIVSVAWYNCMPKLIFFIYIPLLIVILFAFLIRFLRSVNGASRIQFFIYFCSLEILPYLLLIKLLIISS